MSIHPKDSHQRKHNKEAESNRIYAEDDRQKHTLCYVLMFTFFA